MAHKQNTPTKIHKKTLILGIQAPYNSIANIDSYFEEFTNLVKTNRVVYDKEFFIKLRTIDSTYFITKGKLEEIKTFCEQNNIEEIIVSEPLTAQQERNISDILDCNILDRTGLILQIFEKAAHSAEGKTQVGIAMLQYKKTRIAGKGVSMSQQAGHFGTRGPGETAKEKELRHINNNILRLRRQLAVMHKARETQRKRRINAQVPHICLIGYTNAGKSTILNALTKSNVYAQDQLFATLDTTTRELYIDGQKKGLLSDTVGFIQLLPHQLIEAFKSTLSELQYADLLLHVVDASNPNFPDHIKVVQDILTELKVNKPILYVFNKADKIINNTRFMEDIIPYMPRVIVNSLSKETLQELNDFLASWQITE